MHIKNFVIGVAILVLTIAVVVYGINTFYEKPDYKNFCKDTKLRQVSEEECIGEGGDWIAEPVIAEDSGQESQIKGYCNLYPKCYREYDAAREAYSRNIFLIAMPIGILIIIIGFSVFSLDAVGAGLMGGGVGAILYGVMGYWRYTGNLLRFLISLIGLVVLIFIAYYANRKWKKK